MPLSPIPGFVSGSYNSRARGASACRTINLRVEKNEDPNSKSPATMFPRSGRKHFATLPPGPIIGMWANKNNVFVVSGGVVYKLNEDATFSTHGSVASDGTPATMRANGNQLLICSAGNVYIDTGVAIFQPIISFASGNVDVAGTAVTWVAGDKFTGTGGDIKAGDLFMLQPNLYVVAGVVDDQHLVLDRDAGILSNYSYQAGAERLKGVMPEFIDGYFIVSVPMDKIFRISNLFDGSTWSALDFQKKSGSADNIAAINNFSGQLAIFGDTNSTELWADSGNQDFPFQRVSGQSLNVGTAAPWSVAKLTDGSLCWLLYSGAGEDQVVQSTGGEPVRISDHALENAMRTYSTVADAVASTYTENGHEFYRLDFPRANRTWEWDKSVRLWVELGISTPQDEVYGAEPGRFRVHVTWPSGARMDLAGDYASGTVWQVSPDFLDDDGVDFPVMRIAPHINTNLERMNCPAFALDCELGTIDPNVKGADGKELIPTVSLFYSNDGARNWIDAGVASLGRVGEYEGTVLTQAEKFDAGPNSQTNPQVFEPRPYWRGLGSFWVSRTYKIKSSGRMLRAVYNGLAEISK